MPVPNALALDTPLDHGLATAAQIRNDLIAIQSAANAIIGYLTGANGGDQLVYDSIALAWKSKARTGSFNVRDYNAKGDGSTNDTTAFVNALAAAAGGHLIVPAGSYVIASQLTIPNYTTVALMPGAVLRIFTTGGVDAILVGNGSALVGYGYGGSQAQIRPASAANIRSVVTNTVQDGTQQNWMVKGIYFGAEAGATISRAAVDVVSTFIGTVIEDCTVAGADTYTNAYRVSCSSASAVNPIIFRNCIGSHTLQHVMVITDVNPPVGTSQILLDLVDLEHPASGFHGLYIKGFGYGSWKNILITQFRHENANVASSTSAAIYVDHPDVGLTILDAAVSFGASAANKRGIWIGSATPTRRVVIGNVYNDTAGVPTLVDDFNGITYPNNFDIPEYQVKPRVRVYHNTTQSLANATITALNMNSERYDPYGLHDTVTNNTRVTVDEPGVYALTGQVEFAASVTGIRKVFLRVNGTQYIAIQTAPGVSGDTCNVSVSAECALLTGDYVELCAYQTSGGALNSTNGINDSPSLTVRKT